MESDEELVRRSVGGDQDAFAVLVSRHREMVFRLAVSILGTEFRGDAEEVAQEVFLRVHHGLRTFRSEAKFGSWLYRVAFHVAVNLKQRVRYRVAHLTEEVLSQKAAGGPDALEQVEAARRQKALEDCMHQLPDVYQSSLRLHYLLGHSVAEVAALLEVPENTVKSYLLRSRRLLEVMLKERGIEHA
jgi:RNA polymerase sigma-70 factor, ECF subfamily